MIRPILAALVGILLALPVAPAGAGCLILGDSIAVGLRTIAMPECEMLARGGINSWQFNRMWPGEFRGRVVVVSLGSNDHAGVKTADELQRLRTRVEAERVYWILPAGNLPASRVDINDIRQAIRKIAFAHGDAFLSIEGLTKDRIHPSAAGYRKMKEQIAP